MMGSAASELLAQEAQIVAGDPPAALAGALVETPSFAIARDGFMLSLPSGLRCHYQQGRGVTCSRPEGVPDAEVRLFLNGSVYGAIAWINGFVPLHASAVVHDGQVHAFTGETGAGKSTLAAALTTRGLPLFADDVLVLDLREPGAVIALPGHKQLKLWADALELTGHAAGEQVHADMDKFFVDPGLLDQARPLPVAELYFLDEQAQAQPVLTAMGGAERFECARAALYRPHFCHAIADTKNVFASLSRIATGVRMYRFDRSRNRQLFGEGVDFMASAVRGTRQMTKGATKPGLSMS